MSKQIIFKISKNGDVLIDKVEGYGSSCLEATKFIEKSLGLADESTRRMTEEYEEPISLEIDEHLEQR
jgi:hypothetical protein